MAETKDGKEKEYILVEKLIEKGYHIAFAESCTAGKAAARLVNVPDASKVLDVSFVTYANEAKIKYLGVKSSTIEEFGVVSAEVAGEMAEGVAKESGAEIGVGISGIAGPSGGSPEKPVGMVCFGFYINGKIYTYVKQFGDIGRNNVRDSSVDFCYNTLLDIL